METIFEILEGNTIADCIISTCLLAVVIGLPMVIWCAGLEWICKKFNLTDKIAEFFSEPDSEE